MAPRLAQQALGGLEQLLVATVLPGLGIPGASQTSQAAAVRRGGRSGMQHWMVLHLALNLAGNSQNQGSPTDRLEKERQVQRLGCELLHGRHANELGV